eukprot:s235_g3.t1
MLKPPDFYSDREANGIQGLFTWQILRESGRSIGQCARQFLPPTAEVTKTRGSENCPPFPGGMDMLLSVPWAGFVKSCGVDLSIEVGLLGSEVTLQEVENYWAELPVALREMVSEEGEVNPDLLTYLVDDDEQRGELLRSLGCPEVDIKEKSLVLEALQLISAEGSGRLRRNRVAKRGAFQALEQARAEKQARQAETAGLLLEGEEPSRRWLDTESGAIALPRRRRRATDLDLPEGAADEIQQREKLRWEKESQRVVALLEENMDLPIVKGAEDSMQPEEYLKSAVGAYRSSTLRKRLAEWAKYVLWLETVHRVRWPSRVAHTVDYLTELRLVGAPPSVPQAFATTLAFFERAAGIRQEQRLSEDPSFRRALDHTNKEMESERPDKRQAPILPLKVIAAMELLVMNPAAETFVRFAAWTKLIKLWTASRTDDLQGITLRKLKFTKAGLHGIFWKTKVSGPGKKNKILPFMVNARVSVTGLPWLKTGMDILEERYWYPRDYLVPMYPESLEDLERRRPASYEDFALMTRLVYSRLKDAQFDGNRWVGGRSPLLLPELYRLWTEHSERNWLVTIAASTGIHREERQALGRWAVRESSDEYIRAAQRIVSRVQAEVLARLRADREWDLRHSGLDAVEEYIRSCKYDSHSIERQLEKLQVPELWTPMEKDDSFLAMVRRPKHVEPDEVGAEAMEEQPEERLPPVQEILEERPQLDDPGDEEDDVDIPGKFFIAINVRTRHRKLHIWGKCGTKPGCNFSAYEPHDVLRGVEYHSLCGHCWKDKVPGDDETSSSSSSSTELD